MPLYLNILVPTSLESTTYSRVPPGHEEYKYRLPIILATRLFLIDMNTPSPINILEKIHERYLLR